MSSNRFIDKIERMDVYIRMLIELIENMYRTRK